MVPFLRSLLDVLIAFAGMRAKLVAENLLLRRIRSTNYRGAELRIGG